LFLEGKFAYPQAGEDRLFGTLFDEIETTPIVLIESPPGYLLASNLVAGLLDRGCPIIWVSFTKLDSEPAACLLSLVGAFQAIGLDASNKILALLQTFSHIDRKWVNLFHSFAELVAAEISAPFVLVLDRVDLLHSSPETLIALFHHFLPFLPHQAQVILISQSKIVVPINLNFKKITTVELTLPDKQCMQLIDLAGFQLSTGRLRSFLNFANGNAEALLGLCAISKLFGIAYLDNLFHRYPNPQLLEYVSRALLLEFSAENFTNVALLVYLGFNHRMISQEVTGCDVLPDFPLGESLQNGWVRPYSFWHVPLRRVVTYQIASVRSSLIDCAQYLCDNGAFLEGLDIFRELGATNYLAKNIEYCSSELLRYGQYQFLKRMIEDLRPAFLSDHPSLFYVMGEISLFTRDLDSAIPYYQKGIELSARRGDSVGICTGLLAVSFMARLIGDLKTALLNAKRARDLADFQGLSRQLGWAEYQLGCLHFYSGSAQEAMECFTCASAIADSLGDNLLQITVASIAPLAQNYQVLKQMRMEKFNDYQDIYRIEREQIERIRAFLDTQKISPQNLAKISNWLEIPLILKISRHDLQREESDRNSLSEHIFLVLGKLWQRFFNTGNMPKVGKLMPGEEYFTYQIPQPEDEANADRSSHSGPMPITCEFGSTPARSDHLQQDSAINLSPVLPVTGTITKSKSLVVYFLGRFRIGIDDTLLESVPGGLVGCLLKYLLFYRSRRISREELIEVLWPDTDLEHARNRLNVALSSVRQVFRDLLDLEIIQYQNGMYMINPHLDVWIDLEEFDFQLAKAQEHDQQQQHAATIKALEVAANLYQGDFLEDDPYDEWTVFTRERIRLAFQDALVQLAHHYFELGQYAVCVAVCQSILERDNCREDVHCLLMRAYGRQDQFHLGLRQYQTCVEALHRELDIEPAEATQVLYRRLKRREHTNPGIA
jgi:DNA-binding SARP family transcriptional activator